MPTPQEIVIDIIENHEKQTYDEVDDEFRLTILEAVNRAIRYLYNYHDWTFRAAYLENFEYTAASTNTLPADFLSFNQTGAVFLRESENGRVLRELKYKPLPEMVRMIKGPNNTSGGDRPIYFSLGGPLDGSTNQREILLYPNNNAWLDIIYQASSPGPFIIGVGPNGWEEPIPRIPVSWHYVIREMAIVFRLVDKEGDSERYQNMLKTCMKTMSEQEPHGREATHISLPKKLWWRMGRR